MILLGMVTWMILAVVPKQQKLVKVPYLDLRYTWHNGQYDMGTILKKLDLIFNNSCLTMLLK
jgi:hypothetical protein